MPRIAYVTKNFRAATMAVITQASAICTEYAAQGFILTLRQLYYQFVARGLIANNQREYDKLGAIVNDARLAGLLDWNYIEDRTRGIRAISTWEDVESIISSAAASFTTDKWKNQQSYVEVWIEKDALVGVFERICNELEIPLLSCRGYTSQSEVWRASRRLISKERAGQETSILHFGDHDPSGIDMTRDIQDRLYTFGAMTTVNRLALTMDQVNEYTPPPNPAKFTDSRASGYIAEYGYESWELDALTPQVLEDLVRENVEKYLDQDQWDADVADQDREKARLTAISEHWDESVDAIKEAGIIDD